MQHTHDELFDAVVKCLKQINKGSHTTPIDESTDPFKDLGCDSEDGLFVACELEVTLGITIPANINPLVDDARKKPRKIKDIVALLETFCIQDKSHD